MKPKCNFLFLIPFLIAALACSLGSSGNPTPTSLPPATTIVIVLTVPPSPTATAIPQTDSVVSTTQYVIPGCTLRSDWKIITIQANDSLSNIATLANTTVEALAAGNCLANPQLIYAGQSLLVPLTYNPVVVTTQPGCPYAWFFTMSPNSPEASVCPLQPVIASGAAGQDFDGGRAYYYAAAPNQFPLPLVYVIYNDGSWQQFTDTYTPGDVTNDPNNTPPQGRFAPARAIGKVWHDNPTVRQRLGWPYAPEADFAGRRQLAVNTSILYIDHEVRNSVLRLNAGNGTWVVGGGY